MGVFAYCVGFCVARSDKMGNARAFSVGRVIWYDCSRLFYVCILSSGAVKAFVKQMEINEFVKKFAGKFEDTDESEFTPETQFQELDEWDSMTALMIIALIRTEYDKKISAMEIRNCKTINDLYNLAESK